MEQTTAKPLLTVTHLKKHFKLKRPILDAIARKPVQTLKAVDDVSFTINQGETMGLVGESGCGKSSLARTIMRLYRPDSGSVVLDGEEISALRGKELRDKRSRFQMVFQDPYSSLNPRMTVRQILEEALKVHNMCPPKERDQQILKLLKMVGMNPDTAHRYPGEFSGGQRQRFGLDHRRRAGVRPGCVHPGPDHQPADGAAAESESDHAVHLPRSAGGASDHPPGGGDVSGQDRGAVPHRGAL